ncbi:MAG: preprotein translocase subunit SecY [Candidatus Bipolaricaulis sp.]|uniref:Protein translocase subunit SecY n=1 Tax=Candidatus Bipolaricaulis anaerobius TaxID=2026885 RepID=A0A2X3MKL9_9BACT|nr:preprotein translocase subunit SecY [Candidatus Bipolaricaulis anaerobius]SQD92695.1 preprotein translocase membrane subunit [Candidatus Bipolaricaulis anaerobius]
MLGRIRQVFAIEELRRRILYTLGMLLVFRIGAHIPVPGVDTSKLADVLAGAFGAGLFQFINMYTGGALQQFSLFSLGVIPYINASIILSLLIPVFPRLKKLQEEGREGRRKLTQYTRWGTVALALVQSYAMGVLVIQYGLAQPSVGFYLSTIISLTAGTVFLMWVGERITENGIGNGVSMLIMAGIVARLPAEIQQAALEISAGTVHPLWGIGLIVLFVAVIALTVIVQQGQRKIVIQYAKRTSGRRVYGGHTTHLPLRVNQGGVIPIIFASAILTLPSSIATWVPQLNWLQSYVAPGSTIYLVAYVLLIFFFTYFYSSLVFDPNDIAKNLREAGGFVPGVRPGQPTADYLGSVTNRLLLVGGVFLAGIAVLPFIFSAVSGLQGFSIGGTSILILVGVGIDTIMQIEAHLVMRQYESLIKGSAFLGRKGL